MLWKTRENFFEGSHKYREQKYGTKKSANFFLKILKNIARKNMEGKNERKIFYYHNNVESKKMDFKKRAENFFIFTRMSREKNGVKKTREIFLDSHECRE